MCRNWMRRVRPGDRRSEQGAGAGLRIFRWPTPSSDRPTFCTASLSRQSPELQAAIAAGQRHPGVTGTLAYAYAAAGQKEEAQKILEQLAGLAPGRFGFAFHIARIHAVFGDKDQAFEWLQKACDDRDPLVIWLKVDRTFDNLRSDKRFDEILQEMRLADKVAVRGPGHQVTGGIAVHQLDQRPRCGTSD